MTSAPSRICRRTAPISAASPVRLDAELVPVAAGDADRRAGRDQARSGHASRGDRIAQDQLEVPDRSRAAGGRDAGPQRPGGMARRGQDDLRVGPAGDRGDRALGRVEGVVGVRVDQPGEQRPATARDDPRRGLAGERRRPRPVRNDGGDPLAIHDDVQPVTRLGRHAVDEPDILEDRAHPGILDARPAPGTPPGNASGGARPRLRDDRTQPPAPVQPRLALLRLRARQRARPADREPRGRRHGGELIADWQPLPHHAAFDGILNGGVIGTLLDCHSNWTAAIRLMHDRGLAGPPGCVTADYAIRLRRPTPIDRALRLRARPVEIGGRSGRRRRRSRRRWHHHRHMPRHVRRRRSRSSRLPALVEELHVQPFLRIQARARLGHRAAAGPDHPRSDRRDRHRPADRGQARGDATRAGAARRVGRLHAGPGRERRPRHQRRGDGRHRAGAPGRRVAGRGDRGPRRRDGQAPGPHRSADPRISASPGSSRSWRPRSRSWP